jgi:hypothetical protein
MEIENKQKLVIAIALLEKGINSFEHAKLEVEYSLGVEQLPNVGTLPINADEALIVRILRDAFDRLQEASRMLRGIPIKDYERAVQDEWEHAAQDDAERRESQR